MQLHFWAFSQRTTFEIQCFLPLQFQGLQGKEHHRINCSSGTPVVDRHWQEGLLLHNLSVTNIVASPAGGQCQQQGGANDKGKYRALLYRVSIIHENEHIFLRKSGSGTTFWGTLKNPIKPCFTPFFSICWRSHFNIFIDQFFLS